MKRAVDRFGVPAALVGVAAIWGFTFVLVASAIARYPMFGFLGWRFAVAAVTFVVLFPRVLRRLDGPNLTKGLVAGAFLTTGYIFQTWGLAPEVGTTPARAAFITGLYVILVPLMQAVWLRRMPRAATLLGAGLALAGLWLLSGAGQGSLSTGDMLVAICALAYSLHMIVLGSTDERHDTAALTFVQLLVAAVVCSAISLITEEPVLPPDAFVWMAIILCGVLASAVAFVVQTWAQRRIPPARVALILVTEPAFGGLFGWAVAGVWPIREVMGAALMLGGMITSEVVAASAPAGEHVEFEAAMQGIPVALVEDDREPGRMFAEGSGEDRES